VDRLGSFSVAAVSTVAVASLPVLYGVTPTYWLGLGFEIVSGIGWAGYALGNLNYALEVAPPHERTHYSAVVNAAAGVGSFIGPLLAALMLVFMGPRIVLILAGVVRLSAFFALQLARPAHSLAGDPVASASESA
jgi:MFS family permease